MDQESFDKLVKAVMMAESGGRRYASDGKTLLSSPKGARGEMQVLDSTMRSPGYGVKPAQDDSPDERARVGRDVLRAMLSKYGGDLDKTLASYNWGPGNVDRWVSRGADFSQLPQETQKYISVIKRRLGADTAVAKTPAAPEPPQPPAAAYPASLPPAAAAPSEAPAVASRTEGLGPGYQAALALAFLGDEDDREGSRDEDGRRLGVAKSWLDQEFPTMTPDMLSVSVRSPFPEEEEGAKSIEALRRRLGKPLKRADGGMIGVGYGGGDLPVGYSGGGTAELPPELSEEELKKPAFGRYPSSGKGRKQGRVSETLQSGEAQTEAAKGLSMLPFNLVGAPVDLATLLMRPFGYNVEKPVGGSDYLKDKARAAGLAFNEPEDPTLRAFFRAGDLASNLINPAAATRGVTAPITKIAEMTRRAPAPVPAPAVASVPAPAVASARGLEQAPPLALPAPSQAAQMLSQMETPAVTPPVARRERTPKPPAPPIPSHVPTAETPFVGRLDQHVAQLRGPVTKEQFINSLRGRFRDYDIGRTNEALADLNATDKITPQQLFDRLQEVYSPRDLKTRIFEPRPGQYYQTMDNPYPDKPLGLVGLNFAVNPADADKLEKLKLFETDLWRATTLGYGFGMPKEAIKELVVKTKDILNDPQLAEKVGKAADSQVKLSQFRRNLERFVGGDYDKQDEAQLVQQLLNYRHDPIHPQSQALTNFSLSPGMLDELKGLQQYNSPDGNRLDTLRHRYSGAYTITSPIKTDVETDLSLLKIDLNNALTKVEKPFVYQGQHFTGKLPNQIGFSRFSDHEVALPDVGNAKIMHFTELQSDLLQDIRRYGPRKGSSEKDQELINKLQAKLNSNTEEINNFSARLAPGQLALSPEDSVKYNALRSEGQTLRKRINEIQNRRSGTFPPNMSFYQLPEAFADMENSPAVVQQLLLKNAIQAAVQRGVNGATFPGKESKQAQLYESLPNNLKQVVKDLGPGFEIRSITLQGPSEQNMHWGVTWSPEAAERILTKGVPFKHGGFVERQETERRYI